MAEAATVLRKVDIRANFETQVKDRIASITVASLNNFLKSHYTGFPQTIANLRVEQPVVVRSDNSPNIQYGEKKEGLSVVLPYYDAKSSSSPSGQQIKVMEMIMNTKVYSDTATSDIYFIPINPTAQSRKGEILGKLPEAGFYLRFLVGETGSGINVSFEGDAIGLSQVRKVIENGLYHMELSKVENFFYHLAANSGYNPDSIMTNAIYR